MAAADLRVHEAHRESFWTRYVFSQDHKVIGIQYLLTSFVMLLIGGALAMAMRVNLAWPQSGILQADQYLAAVSMHGTLMVFFVLTPALLGGFANFLVPLKIGARDMAFPFINMLSYWVFLLSALVLLASFFVPGGPLNAGWTAYPPLSALPQAAPGSGPGQSVWLLSIAIFCVSSLLGSLNYITTILVMRTPGMSLGRMPLTVWGIFLAAILALLTFPVLMAAGILLLFDRHAGTSFFVPTGLVVGGEVIRHTGGNPLLWQHLFWFFGHPEVYIVILPPMGIVSDVIANFARKPIFGYPAMVGSMVAITVLSFVVWGHHMFVSGMHPLLGTGFAITTLLIGTPSAVKTFNWLVTLWRGKLYFSTAMLFALGFVSTFVAGGLTGIFLGNAAVDIPLHDTFFVVGHFHLVMGVAALFGIFAGTYFWFPKMFGRMMDERLGRWHFWLSILGVYGTFFPMYYLGLAGMHRRIYNYQAFPYLAKLQPVQVFITLSAFLIFLGGLVFAYNLFTSLANGPRADRNPWRGTTLEWSADSPPPHGNWHGEVPRVYRGPYEYSVPGAREDYLPQWLSPVEAGVEVRH
ncbi:MAG: cbb3-type cytochrome c oxidase subunit I [Armatimonadota bacterium]|nr:cbb3-type cytochrome c oxidase subunit I [Armatimonadota bacterium]MDR7440063.1 cbb3-type cytochrome c oxidase subunit I [Armatimonadota bacterium]MDR7562812.1 cbb3-type cytochrome c oxidase subunit I [Armatimonadota bacterium]MDR7568722.1 cbb3-type cytochrome c oxidase subunit I [Armatimonadota bacterium]MDR7601735.1 cbb3-type cytochrome c oxidase subunit I [Armatimonadota bacterium]